ncbi:hypothetical protein BUALT_Bualt01G0225000 [Buddleja alternifolia]|uniref:Uncharacterized protein n=1 Tax=Buddleja alternifolia TaxID=168488 RepID=A0AAV6YG52_9LAMI|nr:hypothetical protein BUALT_Bualt01G0225000 [Buddleja alternifolia]
MEEDGMRARSFRYEDYNTRRVFLRSYPLQWSAESEAEESKEDHKEEPVKVTANRTNGKKPIKKIMLAVIEWGEERVVVLRKFKHKITIYVVNCVPVNFKAPTALISVK